MRSHPTFLLLCAAALCAPVAAVETTVRNDSLVDFGAAVVVGGFAPDEKAASWLTSPCNGAIRGVQVFWRSASGTSGQTIHLAIEIFRAGTFPTPGALAETIGGPVLTDGVLNEYRFLDENMAIPLNVPVSANETFVVSLQFDTAVAAGFPSVVRDVDGNTAGRNALLADLGGSFVWFNSQTLGVNGDWVIRAVVDCPVVAMQAEVGAAMSAVPGQYLAGQNLAYTIVVNNAGPSASPSTTIVDVFPAQYLSPIWTCTPSGGANCNFSGTGTGNITQSVSLPVGGSVTYAVSGNVQPGFTGDLVNSVSAVVGGSVTDPNGANNTFTLTTLPFTDAVFADGFE